MGGEQPRKLEMQLELLGGRQTGHLLRSPLLSLPLLFCVCENVWLNSHTLNACTNNNAGCQFTSLGDRVDPLEPRHTLHLHTATPKLLFSQEFPQIT